MLVAGFDLETTGLNLESDSIIESAVVLWDTERKCPMKIYSEMVFGRHIPPLEPIITELTGITNKDLESFGRPAFEVLDKSRKLLEEADYIIAHNGNIFDRPMFANNCERHSVKPVDRPWIDTVCDVQFPVSMNTRKLKHLAAEHGFVNPFAHRALFDVLTMLRVAQDYDWEKIIAYAKAPNLIVKAETSFQQKELAKKQNFMWNNEKKIWFKNIKDFQLEATRKAALDAGFNITVLTGDKK